MNGGRMTMPDREKVIKGLECCMKWTGEPDTATCHCSDCSYTNMDILGQRCLIDLINDALELLKEQQEQIEQMNFIYGFVYGGQVKEIKELVRCKDCRHYTGKNCNYNDIFPAPREDWYCADGERRQKNE